MKITVDGKNYELNVERSLTLGVLKEVKRAIKYKDLKNGDIVRWKSSHADATWSESVFLMVDVTLTTQGQSITLSTKGSFLSQFGINDYTLYAVLNKKTGEFDTEI
jgi:hypothetical protein